VKIDSDKMSITKSMTAALKTPKNELWNNSKSVLETEVTCALKLATAFGGKYEYRNKIFGWSIIRITKTGDRLRIRMNSAVCEVELLGDSYDSTDLYKNKFRIIQMNRDWYNLSTGALDVHWEQLQREWERLPRKERDKVTSLKRMLRKQDCL
jgi:hypothetical protein